MEMTLVVCTVVMSFLNHVYSQTGATPLEGGPIWFRYLVCNPSSSGGDTASRFFDIQLASDQDTVITVFISSLCDSKLNDTFRVPAHSGLGFRVSSDLKFMIRGSGHVSNQVVLVRASAPIYVATVYGSQGGTEGTVVPEERELGTVYRAISYSDPHLNKNLDENILSEFVVAAFEDSTRVTITPSVPTFDGSPADIPFEIVLSAGECYQLQTEYTLKPDDVTGSTITSSKPVAVYGAHGASIYLPNSYDQGGEAYGGLLCESVTPMQSWGHTFACQQIALRPTKDKYPGEILGDVVRVLALEPRTTVRVNGITWGSALNANEFRDTLISSPLLIETSSPSLVVEYSHCAYWQEDSTGNTFMVMVPPVEQMLNRSVFFLTQDTNYDRHYLNIVTESSSKNKLMLDGKPVIDTMFTDLPTTTAGGHYSVGSLKVSSGYHVLTSPTDSAHGFNAFAYGTPGIVVWDGISYYPNLWSYGITTSSAHRTLQGIFAEQAKPVGTSGSAVMKLTNLAQVVSVLDSASIKLDSASKAQGYTVSISRTIGNQFNFISPVLSDTVRLSIVPRPKDTVTGTMTIYHHINGEKTLVPAFTTFVVLPYVQGVVTSDAIAGMQVLPISPNPVSGKLDFLSITLRNPRSREVILIVTDILGRQFGDAIRIKTVGDWQRVKLRAPITPGIYSVVISDGTERNVENFVVTR